MKIVVDSNIIFSALLKTETTFGQIIFNSSGIFEFYSTQYMRLEIQKHWDKLLKISKLSEDQLQDSYFTLMTKIALINESIVSQKHWEEAEVLTADIDLNDSAFLALTKHLKGKLWTGDKTLLKGLKSKGFRSVLHTGEILKLWNKKREEL